MGLKRKTTCLNFNQNSDFQSKSESEDGMGFDSVRVRGRRGRFQLHQFRSSPLTMSSYW